MGTIDYSVLVWVEPETADLLEYHEELMAALGRLEGRGEVIYLLGEPSARSLEQAKKLHEGEPDRIRSLQFARAGDRAQILSTGIEAARGEVLLTVPARFEVDLQVLEDLRAAIDHGADLAYAARSRGKSGASARIQSELFNRAVSLASGQRFHDIASETRAMRRRVAEETPIYGDFYRYIPLLAERLGFRVEEIPAAPHPRSNSPAVHALRLYLWRAIDVLSIFFISRFTRHPLRLFGGVGAGFAASGGLVLLVTAIQRFTGTPLADRPALVLGTLLVGLGMQTFTIGLLGELILFFHARGIRDYRVGAIYGSDPLPLSGSTLRPRLRADAGGSDDHRSGADHEGA